MIRHYTFLVAIVLSVVWNPSLLATSFNCDKARTPSEKAICQNDQLSKADEDMARLYWQVIRSLSDTLEIKELKRSQADWLKQRDTCSEDTLCLWQAYQKRITVLSKLTAVDDSKSMQIDTPDVQDEETLKPHKKQPSVEEIRPRAKKPQLIEEESQSTIDQKTATTATVEQKRIKDYTIKIYPPDDEGKSKLLILKNNKQLYVDERNEYIQFNLVAIEGDEKNGIFIKDITESGVDNLVVQTFTGGAHCCFGYVILNLGNKVTILEEIPTEHSELMVKDVDDDGKYELLLNDWTFAYWNAGFAESPAPRVILEFQEGNYIPSLRLMKRQPKSLDTLWKTAAQVAKQTKQNLAERGTNSGLGEWDFLPPTLWATLLDLLYTGNPDLATEFLNKAWFQGAENKDKFLQDFKKQLSNSFYWKTVKEMNKSF